MARMDNRNKAHRVLVGEIKTKMSLVRPKSGWEDNKKIGY
jgi:hypothetical protein